MTNVVGEKTLARYTRSAEAYEHGAPTNEDQESVAPDFVPITANPDAQNHPWGSPGDVPNREQFADMRRDGFWQRREDQNTAYSMDHLVDSDSIAGDPWGIQRPIGGSPDDSPNPGAPKDSSGRLKRSTGLGISP